MKLIINNSDYIGATSSGLCMLHCFATPFIFLSQSAAINISQEITFQMPAAVTLRPWLLVVPSSSCLRITLVFPLCIVCGNLQVKRGF